MGFTWDLELGIWDFRSLDPLLVSKQKKSGSACDSDGEKDDIVFNEIRKGHEGDAEEHWFPDLHPLSVNERDETDRSKEQSADEVGAVEDWHADILAIFGPALPALAKLRVDPLRIGVPRFATSNKETTWLRNFSRLRALSS